jgi:hypothetical protein
MELDQLKLQLRLAGTAKGKVGGLETQRCAERRSANPS